MTEDRGDALSESAQDSFARQQQLNREWKQRPPEQQIYFEPRVGAVDYTRYNEAFSGIQSELQAVYETGELGQFQILAPAEQMISTRSGMSRIIFVTHPEYSGYIFGLSGIGQVTLDEQTQRLVIHNPDATRTPHDLGLSEEYFSTTTVYADGTVNNSVNHEPLGGYWESSAVAKYDKTAAARETYKDTDFSVCVPVAAGKYDQPIGREESMGFFVYALPAEARPLPVILQEEYASMWRMSREFGRSLRPVKIGPPETEDSKKARTDNFFVQVLQTRYAQTLRQLGKTIAIIGEHNQTHNQAHPGNVYGEPKPDGTDRIWLTDWVTVQDISDHRRDRMEGEDLSPYDRARWVDFYHTLLTSTTIENDELMDAILRVPFVIAYVRGYAEYEDRDNALALAMYHEIRDRTKTIVNNPDTARALASAGVVAATGLSVDYAMQTVLEEWRDESGLFHSAGDEHSTE